MSDLVVARNCCMTRMNSRRRRVGVGVNRSVREGKECTELLAVRRNGYCAI